MRLLRYTRKESHFELNIFFVKDSPKFNEYSLFAAVPCSKCITHLNRVYFSAIPSAFETVYCCKTCMC